MRIMLIGGGSGGHITPLLAVARELKKLKPDIELIGVCEKNATFAHLYAEEPAIDQVVQVSAGKYRRYAGLPLKERLTDVKTPLLNVRDAGRTVKGYAQALRVLKRLKPDAMLIKGGFVAVPLGMAASRYNIPFLTHDSDSVPGLANRIVSRWASLHATGMPPELYNYPKGRIVYTGIPVSHEFKPITAASKAAYRAQIGMSGLEKIFTVVGGSQGGEQLNTDVIAASKKLLETMPRLGILHIAGSAKEQAVQKGYDSTLSSELRRRVVVKGFVHNVHVYSGAADIVVSRAGANATAEFALQGNAMVLVPGRLAGGHQDKNAHYFENKHAAVVVPYGDAKTLYETLERLLSNDGELQTLRQNLSQLAKPHAAKELAQVTLKLAEKKG